MRKNMEKWAEISSTLSVIQTTLQETQENIIKLMIEKEGLPLETAEELIQIIKEKYKQ